MRFAQRTLPLRAFGLALTLATAAGCATPPKRQAVYPPPPSRPRIEFVRSFKLPSDIRTGFLQRVWSAIIPYEPSNMLANATGIALSTDDRFLFVAIPKSKRVVRVDLRSGSFDAIGIRGDTRLSAPTGVAVDDRDNLYVADKGLNAVVVFDSAGKITKLLGGGKLKFPNAVAVDRKAQILYVVNDSVTQEGRHTVEAFSLAGEHLRTLGGGKGGADGLFVFPSNVAVSPDGELLVADMLNFRIQVFDREGHFLRKFGEAGRGGPALFDKIHGLAYDTFGNLYVADSMQGVQILNSRAQGLMGFGSGVLDIPMFLAIDRQNHIYVSDLTVGIAEFKLVNTTAEESLAPSSDPAPSPSPATR